MESTLLSLTLFWWWIEYFFWPSKKRDSYSFHSHSWQPSLTEWKSIVTKSSPKKSTSSPRPSRQSRRGMRWWAQSPGSKSFFGITKQKILDYPWERSSPKYWMEHEEILSVCNHFNISNLGPSNHCRIMSDSTHYTSLERGWRQRWHWQRHRQRQEFFWQ